MARLWRWTLSLLMGLVGAVVLGPSPTATAAPAGDPGFGAVIADLGTVPVLLEEPGFSFDGAYYAYLVAAGDQCDLHLYDLRRNRPITLAHARVVCSGYAARWATHADTVVWNVEVAAGETLLYAWDAATGQVSALAQDAHAGYGPGVSADGKFVAFTGYSESHPPPSGDDPRAAGYVYDRTAGVSLPLSTPDLRVDFGEWAPAGHHFSAETRGRKGSSTKDGSCLGSGTSCRVFSTEYRLLGYADYLWSRDGSAAMGERGLQVAVYDFTDRSFSVFPHQAKPVGGRAFLGAGGDRVLGYLGNSPDVVVWNRRTGAVLTASSPGIVQPSPTGPYLLYHASQRDAYRYLNGSTGAAALATYRGTNHYLDRDGFWTADGSSYLGVGPGGCSSLRQWSPRTNTVSLFGPPGPFSCYRALGLTTNVSTGSGRFAAVVQQQKWGATTQYLVDLRRHVLIGPLSGTVKDFSPGKRDAVVFAQPAEGDTERLLLVDPTPVPDVDDKPRWTAATPANGSRVGAAVGAQAHVQLGASDRQHTPVNLYFRWRTTAGIPIASAPKGWSCDRKRLAAGATVADCTFAPPHAHTATRFLDVWVVNHATGAQSDTRSYRVAVKK